MTVTLLNVKKAYGDLPVLADVSLTLEPGKPLCVTGPSGCGKTTLLRLVLGLEKPRVTLEQSLRTAEVIDRVLGNA